VAYNKKRRTTRKKKDLVETAHRLFLQEGIKAVTIGQLCVEASASKATFYKYFTDKEGILSEMLDGVMQESKDKMEELIEQSRKHGMTEEMLLKIFDMKEYESFFQSSFLTELMQDYPHVLADYSSRGEKIVMPAFRELVELAKAQGILRENINIDFFMSYAISLRQMVAYRIQQGEDGPGRMTLEEYQTHFYDLFLYGIVKR
jgi:AcrR family transcriptional regulator